MPVRYSYGPDDWDAVLDDIENEMQDWNKRREKKMSWSVSASGKPAAVKETLAEQFKWPLAEKPSGLSDDGERETVRRISETINQVLETFDPERPVTVSAYGHMAFENWDEKTGGYQEVTLSIKPGA